MALGIYNPHLPLFAHEEVVTTPRQRPRPSLLQQKEGDENDLSDIANAIAAVGTPSPRKW